jgi:Spy/CpxP family protein refolding chaperone
MREIVMKTLRIATACALLASFGLAAAAQAHPRPRPHPHHRVCHTTFVHHHKVTRCH